MIVERFHIASYIGKFLSISYRFALIVSKITAGTISEIHLMRQPDIYEVSNDILHNQKIENT